MCDKIEIAGNGKGIVYRIADCKNEQAFISVDKLENATSAFQEGWKELHSHDFYFLVWFFKGCGTDVVDFKEYAIEAGRVFCLSPGQLHQIKDLHDFEGIVLTFSADFLNNVNREVKEIVRQQIFSSARDASPVCDITGHDIARFKGDIERINYAIKKYKDCFEKKYYLASLLSQFMIDLYVYGRKDTNLVDRKSNEFKIYTSFIDTVEDSFRELHNAKDYAEKVGVSLNTMKKCVFNVSGKSASQLINERIAIEAKRMLYERTSMRVGEISDALGFEDSSNFVKFFRRYAGMTPITFREQF